MFRNIIKCTVLISDGGLRKCRLLYFVNNKSILLYFGKRQYLQSQKLLENFHNNDYETIATTELITKLSHFSPTIGTEVTQNIKVFVIEA
jgi:hypothetical protein